MNFLRNSLLALAFAVPAVAAQPAAATQETTQLVATADVGYPTWWIGPVPPLAPCGYYWRFMYFDGFANANWMLCHF